MTDLYQLDKAFEQSVIGYLVSDRVFFGNVFSALEPDAFPSKEAQLLAAMCMQFYGDMGHGPGHVQLIGQRLRAHCWDARQITVEELDTTLDYLEDALDDLAPVADVLAMFSAILAQRTKDGALEAWALTGDPDKVVETLTMADQIGKTDRSVGLGLTFDGVVEDDTSLVVCPTGIAQFDHLKDDGIRGGQLLTILAATNDGKSLMLAQMAAANIRAGNNVLVHTTEQRDVAALAKVAADLTSIPYKDLEHNVGNARAKASKIMARLRKVHGWGELSVKESAPDFATPAETEAFAEDFEREFGVPPDLIVVDYADRVTIGNGKIPKWEIHSEVWQAYQNMAVRRQCVIATASQAKPLDKGQTWRGKDHFRGSMNKGNYSDVCVSLNWADDRKKGGLHVFKDRTGASLYTITIVPDWAYSRVSAISEYVKAGHSPFDDLRRTDYGGVVQYLDNLDADEAANEKEFS